MIFNKCFLTSFHAATPGSILHGITIQRIKIFSRLDKGRRIKKNNVSFRRRTQIFVQDLYKNPDHNKKGF